MKISVIRLNNKLVLFLVGVLVIAGVFLYYYYYFSKIIFVSGGKELKPIYKVDTEEKKIAISFDACWGASRTEKILQILDKYNVKTTFFLVNIWLEDYPEKAKKIAAAGHEIGLHSTTHPHFTKLSDEKIREELTENKELIKEITGYDAILFRPPFGDYNTRVIRIVQGMGIYPVQWSIDSLDWKDLSAGQIVRRVTDKAGPGDIILFHNDGKNTPEAVDEILKIFKRQGFSVVPVSELIYKGDFYVDINGIQHKK